MSSPSKNTRAASRARVGEALAAAAREAVAINPSGEGSESSGSGEKGKTKESGGGVNNLVNRFCARIVASYGRARDRE